MLTHPLRAQILVTVPACLEILLLSPSQQAWCSRLRYVILDEVIVTLLVLPIAAAAAASAATHHAATSVLLAVPPLLILCAQPPGRQVHCMREVRLGEGGSRNGSGAQWEHILTMLRRPLWVSAACRLGTGRCLILQRIVRFSWHIDHASCPAATRVHGPTLRPHHRQPRRVHSVAAGREGAPAATG